MTKIPNRIALLLLFSIINCGKHRPDPQETRLELPKLEVKSLESSLNQGLFLYGFAHNNIQGTIPPDRPRRFAMRIVPGEAPPPILLSNGVWNFYTVGFHGSVTSSTLDLAVKCDHRPGISLTGIDVSVPFNLREESCRGGPGGESPFSPLAFAQNLQGLNQLNQIVLVSCASSLLLSIGDGNFICSAPNLYAHFRMVIFPYIEMGDQTKNINYPRAVISPCYSTSLLGQNKVSTNLNFPVGNVENSPAIGFELRTYRTSADCNASVNSINFTSFEGIARLPNIYPGKIKVLPASGGITKIYTAATL